MLGGHGPFEIIIQLFILAIPLAIFGLLFWFTDRADKAMEKNAATLSKTTDNNKVQSK